MLTDLEIKIIREMQKGLPLHKRPFLVIAQQVGISEEELLNTIQKFIDKGIIRRFGATIKHQHVGYVANAMVVWHVPREQMKEKGTQLASFPEVTHCYQRKTCSQWSHSIFSMVHGKSQEECKEIARRLAATLEIDSYEIIFSNRELKKSSMQYFLEEPVEE